MKTHPSLPRRIQHITDYLVRLYTDIPNTLPPPVIIKGKSGTGRSWILNLMRQSLESTNGTNTHVISVPMQLSAKNLVKSIVDEISAVSPSLFTVSPSLFIPNSKPGKQGSKKKIVLLIDNIDTLLNLTSGDQAFSSNDKIEVVNRRKKSPPSKTSQTTITKFHHVQDVSEFRSFLIENANLITVIASSSEDTQFMEDPDQPFFQFFNVIEVKPFNVTELNEFIELRVNRENSQKIITLLNNINHDWLNVLTEGRITYAKFVIDAIDELKNESMPGANVLDGEDLIRKFLLLFFGRVSPYIESTVVNLSYTEKKLIDVAVHQPELFYANHLRGFEGNISQTLKALRKKSVITSDAEGYNARYQFVSSTFKAYLRFYKGGLSRDVLLPTRQLVMRK